MNEEVAIVEINGTDYYVPSDSLQYLVVVNNRLVNVGTSTITLYANFRESGVSSSGYPRISVSSMQYATYQSSYNSTSSTLNVSSYNVENRVTNTNTILLIVIVCVLVLSWFRGK